MLTVGEEERHKWRPKHQLQLLQQQQKLQLKGGDSNDPMIVVGRQKSFNNFNTWKWIWI